MPGTSLPKGAVQMETINFTALKGDACAKGGRRNSASES